MKKLLVLTVVICILSACSTLAKPVEEPTTMTTPSDSITGNGTIVTPIGEVLLQTVNPYGITVNLDIFETLSDGYILYGNISWRDPLIPPYGATATLARIEDANGKEIPFEYADAGFHPVQGELRQHWHIN